VNRVRARRRAILAGGALLAAALTPALPASAALPGPNGRIASFCGTDAAHGDSYTSAPDGTDRRVLARGASAVEFTGDGRRVLYVQGVALNARIVVAAADGSGARPLTGRGPFIGPSWSPDPGGRLIAYGRLDTPLDTAQPDITAEARSSLWVMRADGTHRRRLAVVPGLLNGLSWASDGTLVLSASRPTGSRIWTLRPHRARLTEIARVSATLQGLDTSPASSWVAVAVGGADGGLFTLPLGGGTLTRVPGSDWRDLSVVWSPDGRRLLFARLTGTPPLLLPQLYTSAVDGIDREALPGQPCGQIALDWQPDVAH